MKGKNLRPILPSRDHARIVFKVDDSTLDAFIHQDEAEKMLAVDELKKIDLGPHYPKSYMLIGASKDHARHVPGYLR